MLLFKSLDSFPNSLDQRPAAFLVDLSIEVGQLARPEIGSFWVIVDFDGIDAVAPGMFQRSAGVI